MLKKSKWNQLKKQAKKIQLQSPRAAINFLILNFYQLAYSSHSIMAFNETRSNGFDRKILAQCVWDIWRSLKKVISRFTMIFSFNALKQTCRSRCWVSNLINFSSSKWFNGDRVCSRSLNNDLTFPSSSKWDVKFLCKYFVDFRFPLTIEFCRWGFTSFATRMFSSFADIP